MPCSNQLVCNPVVHGCIGAPGFAWFGARQQGVKEEGYRAELPRSLGSLPGSTTAWAPSFSGPQFSNLENRGLSGRH